ncbi:exported hypothetical protein [Neisseria gonorrhoeae]|nr:hypothetical protein M732_07095 [Neisseria gonorrhoeae ATL_2011_05-08]SCW18264.1 exported hypothetical protein [Neisseria gonorrhoeae]
MTRFKYSLLFAALLPVYAQADVSVSDDPKPQESTELPTITVTADRTASSNDGYTVSGTHTPFGLPMTLREIPQSVSVITSQQMRDQNIKTLDRALLQATGTSPAPTARATTTCSRAAAASPTTKSTASPLPTRWPIRAMPTPPPMSAWKSCAAWRGCRTARASLPPPSIWYANTRPASHCLKSAPKPATANISGWARTYRAA